MWKVSLGLGILVVGAWPFLYSQWEGYWWGLPLGLALALGGVIGSGPEP